METEEFLSGCYISLKELKDLALEYDRSNGDYVESKWEGKSVYQFIMADRFENTDEYAESNAQWKTLVERS